MNDRRRKLLKSAVSLLDRAWNIVNDALDQEQDCLDNMPENLQMSERCEDMEAVIGRLEDASLYIDDARRSVEEASV